MVKKDKLIEKLTNSPNNAKFSDIRKLLELDNFVLDRITGSHHIFIKYDIILVIPVHNNRVKSIYVKRVLELIEGA
ncbi:type II toxin-antitoxin system HicA family toxin [Sphaerospermopsis sp. FACHB-1094]|uniref:type II toxin-antitoxin system HicA family toxin n=1 Tax=Sphaerospermopsis sp. FACHB-1094 TaxID=2692861 RepID=UPI0016846B36|nr:type II toxin-antitoxin system HicA family toxin [Sphaerospermopsis sp. FACHB-1094]MBD2133943.1 type II toxin-antitoxin system HicA family toxin [Sphaerospermopsis sp. FACHB-1094]